jgi:hypothetical protein
MHPTAIDVCLLYVNSFEGKFGFILRDKKPQNFEEANEYSADIEDNLLCFKFNHFLYPRTKVEPKMKTTTSGASDPIALIAQKLD